MTHWHYATLELIGADLLMRPTIGPGRLTHDEARQAVQDLLDAQDGPEFATMAATWRRGARDDTVYTQTPAGMLTFTMFQCAEDCAQGWQRWLDSEAATYRSAGLTVTVAEVRTDS